MDAAYLSLAGARSMEVEEQKPRRSKPGMLLLAILFLFEAWVWDGCVAIARGLAALIPWTAFKARVKALIAFIPAPVVLVLVGVPFAFVELIKPVFLWIAATGHPIFGLSAYVIAQFVGVGVIAAMFDLTRDKLMEMPLFVWCYGKVMIFHDFADRLIAPYKEAAKREWRAFRQWLADYRARLMLASKADASE
jgi:hypothetical protein